MLAQAQECVWQRAVMGMSRSMRCYPNPNFVHRQLQEWTDCEAGAKGMLMITADVHLLRSSGIGGIVLRFSCQVRQGRLSFHQARLPLGMYTVSFTELYY